MSNNSFFTTLETALIVWLTNYAIKFPVPIPSPDISNADFTNTLLDAHCYIWTLQYGHPVLKNNAKETTACKHKHPTVNGNSSDSANYRQPSTFPDRLCPRAPGIQKRSLDQLYAPRPVPVTTAYRGRICKTSRSYI